MGTLNAIYIRATEPTVAAAVRSAYPSAFTEPESPYLAVELPDDAFRCPEAELRQFSERLKTEVVWLSFQSAIDAFQYHRWNNGAHLRSLVYGCFEREREWERVEGTPQEWEPQVLFDPATLQREMKYLPAEESEKLRLIFENRMLVVGNFYPLLDARETACEVATFYRFPGW